MTFRATFRATIRQFLLPVYPFGRFYAQLASNSSVESR
jgi:hypothetical protein